MVTQNTRVSVFQSLQVFRKDLDEVVSIFRATKPESTVTLEDGERTYVSFEEMRTISGDEVSRLILQNQEIGIKLDLQKQRNGLTLTTVKTNDDAELTFFRAREFLRSKSRTSYAFWQMLPVISLTVIAAVAFPLYQNRNVPVLASGTIMVCLAVGVVAVGILLFSGKIDATTCMFVTLKRRHEYPPFVKRNRDSLILMVLGTLLGVLVTLVIQYFLKN